MLFVITANDKPEHIEKRQEIRPEHLTYIKSLGDKLKFAGPFVDHDGNSVGSLIVVEADNIDEADAIAKNDPYSKANLFSDLQVRPWLWTQKNPENK